VLPNSRQLAGRISLKARPIGALSRQHLRRMAQANRSYITLRTIPLSDLFTDPVLRLAFKRAEDSGFSPSITFAIPPDRPRVLHGGAMAIRELELA
jgi:hypothetical protein